jgi:hypothetical protein
MHTHADRRTFQAVRRDSKPVGRCEADIWKPTDKRQARQALKAAERFEVKHKPKGRRNGPLGHVGLEVYRVLWSRIRYADGCLCPSIEWIMKACARSRGAVVAALQRLKAAGFLKWVRRFEYTGGPRGVRGPQVRQATNAYALGLPGAALALLPATIIPADELHRQEARARFVAECERTAFTFAPIGRAFAAFEAALFGSASLAGSLNPPKGFNSKSGGRSAR